MPEATTGSEAEQGSSALQTKYQGREGESSRSRGSTPAGPNDSHSSHDDREDQSDDHDEEDDEEDEDDEDEGSSHAHDDEDEGDEEDEDYPFTFLENFDPALFAAGFGTPGRNVEINTSGTQQNQGSGTIKLAAPSTSDPEFYSNIIQMLTHVLGSSESGLSQTPATHIRMSPMPPLYSSPVGSLAPTPSASRSTLHSSLSKQSRTQRPGQIPNLQPLINTLIAKLSGDHHSLRHPVGEREMTDLLQNLMQQLEQQQSWDALENHEQQHPEASKSPSRAYPRPSALASSSRNRLPSYNANSSRSNNDSSKERQPMSFANLNFDEEDEDDPDFNPDQIPDLPLSSAWQLAVQDVVSSEASKAAAAAVAASTRTPPVADAEPHVRSESPLPHRLYTSPARQQRSSLATSTSATADTEHRKQQTNERDESLQTSTTDRPPRSTRMLQASSSLSGKERARPTAAEPPEPFMHNPIFSRSLLDTRLSLDPTIHLDDFSELEDDDGEIIPQAGGGRKRGRKAQLPPEEVQRRRKERQAEYARQKRAKDKVERLAAQATLGIQSGSTTIREGALELKTKCDLYLAEIGRLKDERERLKQENERIWDEKGRAWQEKENMWRENSLLREENLALREENTVLRRGGESPMRLTRFSRAPLLGDDETAARKSHEQARPKRLPVAQGTSANRM